MVGHPYSNNISVPISATDSSFAIKSGAHPPLVDGFQPTPDDCAYLASFVSVIASVLHARSRRGNPICVRLPEMRGYCGRNEIMALRQPRRPAAELSWILYDIGGNSGFARASRRRMIQAFR